LVDASGGHWNLNNMRSWLPSEIINKIVSIPSHDAVDGNDSYVCRNSDGWMSIWQLEVPERIPRFIWLLKHDWLFTNSKRHIMRLGGPFCIHCSDLYETALFVMRDCTAGMSI
jgi:hypothetical protein